MKNLKKTFSLVAIMVFLIAIVGCSEHGHPHGGENGHSHNEENKNSQPKHETLK